MSRSFRVALLGFSAVERSAIAAGFQTPARRGPGYELVLALDDSDFIVADADHPPSVQLVWAVERAPDTLFIGGTAPPPGAAAWMARPIAGAHVVRELDAMAAQARAGSAADSPLPTPTPTQITVPVAALLAKPTDPVLSALVVDDSEIARHVLRSRLERWGLQVECAASSGQAITWLFRRRFDFLFLDVELGARSQLDGLGLCQLIRRKHPPVAGAPSMVVMVSSHHDQIDRVRGTLAGCDAYLGKPLDDNDLARLLRRQGLHLVEAGDSPPLR